MKNFIMPMTFILFALAASPLLLGCAGQGNTGGGGGEFRTLARTLTKAICERANECSAEKNVPVNKCINELAPTLQPYLEQRQVTAAQVDTCVASVYQVTCKRFYSDEPPPACGFMR